MAIMRIEKNRNYTTMSNYHLRDRNLSNKARGLMSTMLSLPEDWDYTTRGLALICKDGVDSITAQLKELEQYGYLSRRRLRDGNGRITDVEYVIYEEPHTASPNTALPDTDLPYPENPDMALPDMENPRPENPAQLNKDILNTYPKKDRNIPDVSYPHPSNVYPSLPDTAADESLQTNPDVIPIRQQTGALSEQQKYLRKPSSVPGMRRLSCKELTEKIRDQIDYQALIENGRRDEIDNIVSIMVEVMSTRCEYFTISGKQYPAELVRQRYSQITYHTVQYVLECMHKCGSDIRNIKQYLIATLFNAPATCDSYYSAAVRRDFEYLRL